jgi:magnesium-transporting ATPase (P-type)
MIFYQLSRPAAYLWIKDKAKWQIDWLYPFLIAAALTTAFFFLPVPRHLYGEKGIVKELIGFLQILPGFYLAALAAIATFNKNDLDFHLPAPTPQIDIKVNGKEVEIELTRRRMLSYLFGYLTFLSLALYLAVVLGTIAAPSAQKLFGAYLIAAKIVFLGTIVLFFCQMIIITIFGLYQLCDRIHQPDQTVRDE